MKSIYKTIFLFSLLSTLLVSIQHNTSKQEQEATNYFISNFHGKPDTSKPNKPLWFQVGWGNWKHRLKPIPGVIVKFDHLEINDTIYAKDLDPNEYHSRKYSFPFTFVAAPEEDFYLLVNHSHRPDGADPDFNCSYPRDPLEIGARDSIVICAPVRKGSSPYHYTRRYIANTTAETRDTLIFRQIYIEN